MVARPDKRRRGRVAIGKLHPLGHPISKGKNQAGLDKKRYGYQEYHLRLIYDQFSLERKQQYQCYQKGTY